MADILENLLVELECPVCYNYMHRPIRQCLSGHNICNGCRSKVTKCPLCSQPFGQSKNISLEKLADTISITRSASKHPHSTLKFKCPMPKCSWTGKYDEIPEHWNAKQLNSHVYSDFNYCSAGIKLNALFINLVSALGEYFWYYQKTTLDFMQWKVFYIGPEKDANQFMYEIHIFNKKERSRTLIIKEKCAPINTINKSKFEKQLCISMDLKVLKPYLDNRVRASFLFKISKIGSKVNENGNKTKKPIIKNKQSNRRSRSRSKKRNEKSTSEIPYEEQHMESDFFQLLL